ncbi:MAG: hypothetical protein ACFFA5_09295 [Promethearchaeota archaeon]
MESLKNDIKNEENQKVDIDNEWLLSLKNVLISFFGCESIAPIMFEHGRNIGHLFFHKMRKIEQNQKNPSQMYLNELCEWLRRNGYGTLKISSYKSLKNCECQITNYLNELDIAYYCGLLTGLLEYSWNKEIEIKCYKEDRKEGACKIFLQEAY